ncbi:MAG: NAD(P)H-dependent oxidoreductase [Lewinella sp.]|nr:NAD(P)H-dependent oxidoreductase [Lewinella sp.]
MITVISGTNRPQSLTGHFARAAAELLSAQGETVVPLIDLETLDPAFYHPLMYQAAQMHPSLQFIQEQYLLPAEKLVFVCPEYNGSYPGVLKLFIDALSVHRYSELFKGKEVALIGVSTGRAGNLRGLDQLAEVLVHMGAYLMQNKLPISQAAGLLDAAGQLIDPGTQQTLEQYLGRLRASKIR